MAKRLMILSSQSRDKEFAQSLAAECGLDFEEAHDSNHLIASLESGRANVFLVETTSQAEYDALEATVQETIGLFSEALNPNLFHFLGTEPLQHLHFFHASPLFGHYIDMTHYKPGQDAKRYASLIRGSLAERAFGLEQYLNPDTKIESIELTQSQDKEDAVEAVRAFVLKTQFHARLASTIALAADELLMNAVFDAPVDAIGKQTQFKTPRNTAIPLTEKNQLQLTLGYDGQTLAVSVLDNFGSFDKSRMLTQFLKDYRVEDYKLRGLGLGSGLGLATLYQLGANLVIVNEASSKAEVIALFRKTQTHKEFRQQLRTFSTYFYL